MYFLCLIHQYHFRHDFPDGTNHDWQWNPPGQSGGWPHQHGCDKKGIMSYGVVPKRWSTCSRQDQVTVFRRNHYRCMVDQNGGGGKTIQVSFCDSSDVSFCQAVLGPGAGAMENRCNLDDTKELALVPGTEGPVAGASALSIVELARIRSFLPV